MLPRLREIPGIRNLSRLISSRVTVAAAAWDRFWFEPADPLLLGLLRLLTGGILSYNLLVWGMDLEAFFGSQGLQPLQAVRELYAGRPIFSLWLWLDDAALRPAHLVSLLIAVLFFLGVASRVTAVLAFLVTISCSQRVPVANFGLDQILALLCLYLIVAPGGEDFSVDAVVRRWWHRRAGSPPERSGSSRKSAAARVALRLIQLHLCAIYFWSGFAKLKGPSWWTGEAMWRVLANAEYQTVDLTWLAQWPWLPFLVAHVTILWEVFFIVLVWNRSLRPLVLAIGVAMHLGIGAFLGMWTFGLIMTFAYLSFVDADVWRQRLERFAESRHRRSVLLRTRRQLS